MQYAISFNSIYCDLLCSNVLEKLFFFCYFLAQSFINLGLVYFSISLKREGGGGESGEEREGSAEIIREM